MKKVEMKVYFKSDIEKVFNVITNMKDCSWRSDLSKVVCIDDGKYIEYTYRQRHSEFLTLHYFDISGLFQFKQGGIYPQFVRTGILNNIFHSNNRTGKRVDIINNSPGVNSFVIHIPLFFTFQQCTPSIMNKIIASL